VSDSQPDNRLSVVSAVSLEPRRRSRHHHSRHSHLHRELAHMLSVSSRDTKELRSGLSTAFDKLDQSRERASHAEKLAVEMLLRVKQAEEERANAMRQASTVREELGKYKALLDNAHGEIRRAQQMLEDQEQLRYEAESSAARARDNARQIKQKRLIELAREQGRKMGFNEGIQAGQRIGYHEGQSPLEDGNFYPDDGPRFREIFNESRYRLEEFDQSPPFRDVLLNPSSPHDAEVPLPTPLPTRQVYPRLHAPFAESLGQSNGATNLPQEYTSMPSPRGVPRTMSTDSSSTTTLPAAPATVHVSSRAPPPMPTIPEVASTDVGSVSRRSRSLRDSSSTQNHTPQMSSHNGVLPSAVSLSQGRAAFEPPPGIMEDPPAGPNDGYHPDSGGPVYESPSPRRAFDDHPILSNGIVPDVSRSPAREHFSSTIHSPAREHFEIIPGDIRSPAQEHFTVIHSPRAIPSPAQENFTTTYSHRDIPSPAQDHFTTAHLPRVAGSHIDGVQLVDSRQNPGFSERPSSGSVRCFFPNPAVSTPPTYRASSGDHCREAIIRQGDVLFPRCQLLLHPSPVCTHLMIRDLIAAHCTGGHLNQITRCRATREWTLLQMLPLTGTSPLHNSYQILLRPSPTRTLLMIKELIAAHCTGGHLNQRTRYRATRG
jgi:hypothetical protein